MYRGDSTRLDETRRDSRLTLSCAPVTVPNLAATATHCHTLPHTATHVHPVCTANLAYRINISMAHGFCILHYLALLSEAIAARGKTQPKMLPAPISANWPQPHSTADLLQWCGPTPLRSLQHLPRCLRRSWPCKADRSPPPGPGAAPHIMMTSWIWMDMDGYMEFHGISWNFTFTSFTSCRFTFHVASTVLRDLSDIFKLEFS